MGSNRLKELSRKLEQLRTKLEQALQAAKGKQQDPNVQELADEFDAVLNEYMRLKQEEEQSGQD